MPTAADAPPPAWLDGTTLVAGSRHLRADARRYRAHPVDLFITLDWQPRFLIPALAHPRVPVLVWMRDPRPEREWAFIHTVRLPGESTREDAPARPDANRAGRSLRALSLASRAIGRRLEIAVAADGLRPALEEMAGFAPRRVWRLGTPLAPPTAGPTASVEPDRPLEVVFIGRLDAIKRPWLVWDVAEACPSMRFTVLGQARDEQWVMPPPPANVFTVGHADRAAKEAILSRADVLLNTSIHEGLPVSMIEALAHGMAVVATTDVEGVVGRFGTVVANVGGDGTALVPDLVAALQALAADPERRAAIREEAPRWVAGIHAPGPFVAQLAAILDQMGRRQAADVVRSC
jgi:glycosyltransferase involved in cell wall biosynthesis